MEDIEMSNERDSPEQLGQFHPSDNAPRAAFQLQCPFFAHVHPMPTAQQSHGLDPMHSYLWGHPQYQGQPYVPLNNGAMAQHLLRQQQLQHRAYLLQHQYFHHRQLQIQEALYSQLPQHLPDQDAERQPEPEQEQEQAQDQGQEQETEQEEEEEQEQEHEADRRRSQPLTPSFAATAVSPASLPPSPSDSLRQAPTTSGAIAARNNSSRTSETASSGPGPSTPRAATTSEPSIVQGIHQLLSAGTYLLSPTTPGSQPASSSHPSQPSLNPQPNSFATGHWPRLAGQQPASHQPSGFTANFGYRVLPQTHIHEHRRHRDDERSSAQQQAARAPTMTVTATIRMTATTATSGRQATQAEALVHHSPVTAAGTASISSSALPMGAAPNPMPAEAPASAGPSQERRASARRFSRRDGMVSPNYGDSHPYDGSTSEGSDSEVLPPPYVVIPYSDFAENSVRQAQASVRDEPTERARHFVHNRGMFRSKSLFSLMKPVKIDELEEDDRMCIICYNDFGVCAPEGIVEHPLRMPKCNHVFGHHCIRRWLVQHNTCPYCRGRIEDPTTDGHRSASGSFRRFNSNLPFGSPSQSSRFPYHRSGLFASSDIRTPTTSTVAGTGTGTARTDESMSSSRHTAVGERRPASSMDSSEQPPRQRARTRHGPSRSSAAAVGTYPHNALHFHGNLQMQSQPPPTSHASMPTFWHVPFNGMQSPPGQLPPNPFLSASDQPNDYSMPLRRPSHPMQSAQTLHTNAASSNTNSNSNSNNNGGPNMPAWGMPVLPLPTSSSTAGLSANASRPVSSTPFNHQLPLSLQPMPTPSFVSNPGMLHTQQSTAMSVSAQTSPVVTQLQDLATETNTSSNHTAP